MSEQAGIEQGRSLAGYPRTSGSRGGSPARASDTRDARNAREARPGAGAPATVRAALRLMIAGAVLDAVATVTIIATRGAARTAVLAHHSVATWHLVDLRLTEDAIAAPVLILVWLWLARANGRGRDWSRFAFMVYFAISTVGIIASVATGAWSYVPADFAVGAALWLVGAATLALIFNPRSGPWYGHAANRD